MPWKESSVMDERLHSRPSLGRHEPMTQVCRDFGISRETGSKIFDRYKEHGLDRSRRPVRFANQLPAQLEARMSPSSARSRIAAHGRSVSCWCAAYLLTCACRPRASSTPFSIATGSSPRLAVRAAGTPLSPGSAPNDLWCTDFKGEFKLGNGRYCYDLGYIDLEARTLQPLDNPFGPRLSPMS